MATEAVRLARIAQDREREAAAASAAAAAEAGLRYVTDAEPGYGRRKRGKGFVWRAPGGDPVNEEIRRRLDSLAIPPAWTDVWACRDPRGHLQATGRDAKGRKQYRYHPRWRLVRDSAKFERMYEFGLSLTRLRRTVDEDLSLQGLPRDKVRAALVWLLDRTLIRIGNDEYARENGSYGLTTLRNRHVRVDGHKVEFRFRAKAGRQHRVTLSDRRMASVVRRCQELPGQVLFEYVDDDDGGVNAVGSTDVNEYLRETTGGDFTAKDFRTWGASAFALARLRACAAPATKKDALAQTKTAIEEAATALGNTPAVCRTSYVNPLILERYEAGELAAMSLPRSPRDLEPEERLLLALCAPGAA